MNDLTLREAIITTALQMNALGINQGKSGNVSARIPSGYLITPSGLAYEDTHPTDVVAMSLTEGDEPINAYPSSEWRFHRDIYLHRPEVQAIVHSHAPFATTLACLRIEVPAFHYMVAIAGGHNIRCAKYATFGTQELSEYALTALQNRKACLLANHGMIALGRSLKHALALAVEVEALCRQYWQARQLGEPCLLTDQEMQLVLKKFTNYGQS